MGYFVEKCEHPKSMFAFIVDYMQSPKNLLAKTCSNCPMFLFPKAVLLFAAFINFVSR